MQLAIHARGRILLQDTAPRSFRARFCTRPSVTDVMICLWEPSVENFSGGHSAAEGPPSQNRYAHTSPQNEGGTADIALPC